MHTIFTLGYGPPDVQQAARGQLHDLSGAVIIDTRYKPRSCFPEWCKPALAREYGRRYVHIPALGNINYRGGPITLADEQSGLERARKLLQQRDIILLCCCWRVETCHRRVIADLLRQATGAPVCHLLQPEQGQQQATQPAERRSRPRRKPAQSGPGLWDT